MPWGRGSSRPLPPPVHPPLAFLGLFLPQSRPLPQAASPLRRRLGGGSLPPHLVLIRLNVLEPRGRGPGVGPIHGGVCSLHPPQRKRKHHRGIPPPDEKDRCSYPLGDSEPMGLYLLLCPQLARTDPSEGSQAVRSAIPGAKGVTPLREVRSGRGLALRTGRTSALASRGTPRHDFPRTRCLPLTSTQGLTFGKGKPEKSWELLLLRGHFGQVRTPVLDSRE